MFDYRGMIRERPLFLIPPIAGISLAIMVAIYLIFFWTETASVAVVTHEWRRVINIEDFGPRHDATWASYVPNDAYQVSCYRKLYQSWFVNDNVHYEYRDWCNYTVDRWAFARRAVARDGDKRPYWPEFELAENEREGKRTEAYILHLQQSGRDHRDQCQTSNYAWWSDVASGEVLDAKIRKLDHSVICSSVMP